MSAQPKAQDGFAAEFRALEERFLALKPETEVTLEDADAGIEGYIVVWNTGISVGGPLEKSGKGGTRITPGVTFDEVRMLARTMALKNAAAGLPWGGAKSGLRADPDAPGFERKYRRFAQLAKPHLHEFGGTYGGFGFDIGARPEHPAWICDELKSTRSFTGKPLAMGGTDYDREGIAGLGVATAALTLLSVLKKSATGATFAVQGLGAMGAAVIRYFSEKGAMLMAVSDPKYGGTFLFDAPPSPETVQAFVRQDAAVIRSVLSRLKPLPAEEVLYQDVDVLFPCAVHNVIREDNVGKIRSRAVVEGANGPLTDSARTVLFSRGVHVVPDFIANPGGIIAAFVELTSKVSPEENVRSRAKVNEAKETTISRIDANVRRMMALAAENSVEPAQAGRYMAYKNIFEGIRS